jgi:hypothetical protein
MSRKLETANLRRPSLRPSLRQRSANNNLRSQRRPSPRPSLRPSLRQRSANNLRSPRSLRPSLRPSLRQRSANANLRSPRRPRPRPRPSLRPSLRQRSANNNLRTRSPRRPRSRSRFKCNLCSTYIGPNELLEGYKARIFNNQIESNGPYLYQAKRCPIICEKTNQMCGNIATKIVTYDPLKYGMKTIFMKTPNDGKKKYLQLISEGKLEKAQELLQSINTNSNSYFNAKMNETTKKDLQNKTIGKYNYGGWIGSGGKWKLCKCHFTEYKKREKILFKDKWTSYLQYFPYILTTGENYYTKDKHGFNSYNHETYEIPDKEILNKGEYVYHYGGSKKNNKSIIKKYR